MQVLLNLVESFTRSGRTMRNATRVVGLVTFGLALSLVTGCDAPSTSNEEGLGKLEGLPAIGSDGGPPPKTQQEYRKSQQAQGANPYAGQGYPGASK
jgi:hypothetical protein